MFHQKLKMQFLRLLGNVLNLRYCSLYSAVVTDSSMISCLSISTLKGLGI